MKIKINEFADSKFNVEMKLDSNTWPIVEHLAKCIIMPDSDSYNHWKSEIVHFIDRVNKLKNTNKFPTKEQIYKWTYGKCQDTVIDSLVMDNLFFDKFQKQYKIIINESPEHLCKVLDEICVGYFTLLSEELSIRGYNNSARCYKYIDDFVSKHNIDVRYFEYK